MYTQTSNMYYTFTAHSKRTVEIKKEATTTIATKWKRTTEGSKKRSKE